MKRRWVLFNPGPVNTSRRVRQALLRGDLCHREIEFTQLLNRVKKNLRDCFDLGREYEIAFLTGSGTGALEAGLVSCSDPEGTVGVLSNGIYGERLYDILTTYGFKTRILDFGLGRPYDLRQVESFIKKDPALRTLAAVHHETSTGMLNPVSEVAQIASKNRVTVIADVVSSLGGEALNFHHLDVAVATANKCIEGLPGVSFVILKKDIMEKMRFWKSRSYYTDLRLYIDRSGHPLVPFTPSVQAFYALDEALQALLEETHSGRIARYRRYHQILRRGFKKMGLEFLLPEKFQSNTLTALRLPRNISYQRLHDALKEKGFVIYAGQKELENRIFRVANMGQIKISDLRLFISVLGGIVRGKSG